MGEGAEPRLCGTVERYHVAQLGYEDPSCGTFTEMVYKVCFNMDPKTHNRPVNVILNFLIEYSSHIG